MSAAKPQIRTLKVRVKDKHNKVLRQMAFETNQVWNAANAFTSEYGMIPMPEVKGGYMKTWFSAFELQKDLKGIRAERGLVNIHSQTVQETIAVHAKARRQFKRSKLKWRTSGGARRSLGWVPFKSGAAKFKQGQIVYNKKHFGLWDSYGLSNYDFRSGSFTEDARGRWYFNVCVIEDRAFEAPKNAQVGIDLGLKTTATCSDGTQLEAKRFYRAEELKLAKAQRANKKKRVKAIHAKIKNRRKDQIHKFSTELTKNNSLVVVGNVSSSKLTKTKMAKSVLDAGWSQLKTQIEYKSSRTQSEFVEVDEAYTTQACSCCGCIGPNSPKGMGALGIREWTCSECGAQHDRDINAAKNILAAGHCRLAGGIPRL